MYSKHRILKEQLQTNMKEAIAQSSALTVSVSIIMQMQAGLVSMLVANELVKQVYAVQNVQEWVLNQVFQDAFNLPLPLRLLSIVHQLLQ